MNVKNTQLRVLRALKAAELAYGKGSVRFKIVKRRVFANGDEFSFETSESFRQRLENCRIRDLTEHVRFDLNSFREAFARAGAADIVLSFGRAP